MGLELGDFLSLVVLLQQNYLAFCDTVYSKVFFYR
jgi:hypothetical protein